MQAYKDLRSTADVQLDMWDHKGRRYVRLGSATFSCSHIQVRDVLGLCHTCTCRSSPASA